MKEYKLKVFIWNSDLKKWLYFNSCNSNIIKNIKKFKDVEEKIYLNKYKLRFELFTYEVKLIKRRKF
jgi:hypothetical protein